MMVMTAKVNLKKVMIALAAVAALIVALILLLGGGCYYFHCLRRCKNAGGHSFINADG